eukprot:SAG31_NODE_381_length_16458_cov_18.069259_7_plen_182_part_00
MPHAACSRQPPSQARPCTAGSQARRHAGRGSSRSRDRYSTSTTTVEQQDHQQQQQQQQQQQYFQPAKLDRRRCERCALVLRLLSVISAATILHPTAAWQRAAGRTCAGLERLSTVSVPQVARCQSNCMGTAWERHLRVRSISLATPRCERKQLPNDLVASAPVFAGQFMSSRSYHRRQRGE